MENLLPCPVCGAPVKITGGDEWHNQHEFWICCENRKECGCVRVGDTEREECIRRWNNIPRALTWTKKTPTVPGVYWLKAHIVSIVEVCLDCNRKLIVLFPGSDEYTPLGLLKECEWCGPIPQPQDAE